MIPSLGSHALRALTPQTAVKVDPSRCVRHRCNRNACSHCVDVCQAEAIAWTEQGLSVDSSRCTQCLSCLAVCPTAALRSPELSLLQVLTDLAAHPDPVLGCLRSSGSKTHAHFSCLGYLGNPELMLLFALVFADGVQCDLTHCEQCPNQHILQNVSTAHARVEALLPDNKVRLIRNNADLHYRPGSLSRRELFGLFRERSSRTAAVMVRRLQVSAETQSYGSKQVPLVRTLLLKAMASLPPLKQIQVADEVSGEIRYTPECTACGRCVGVCPTGALDPVETEHQPPAFIAKFCVHCGTCAAFCRHQGVVLTGKNQDAA